jgi:hypothetical protein
MTRYLINFVVFFAGLAVVCWIGNGYIGSNSLALAVTMLVGAFYLAGAFELQRYQQATSTLTRAVKGLSAPPADLNTWLDQLHPSLRNAARLRIEGERVALPGPALTSYLVGLLVLLGMLGTFLGMVATLKGTGTALESATDLQAIRASLAAPVKGLGFAFGTSIAGVATSAMLGLLSALARRERIQAGQMLDARIATTLRIYSPNHHREEGFRLLQRQTDAMPTLVDRLQAMMTAMEEQSQALNERLVAGQDAFHGKTESAYTRLASSVEQSLTASVAASAQAAGAAIRPAVETTMASLTREAASLHDTVTHAVQQQLDGLSTRFEATTTTVAGIWNKALEGQQQTSEAMGKDLRASLDRYAETFEQRSASLLEGVAARQEAAAGSVSQAWEHALSQHERVSQKLADDNQRALAAAAAAIEQHAASLLRTAGESHAELRAELAAQDQQRLAAWTESLGAMAAALRTEWQQAGANTASQQQEICDTLAQTARDITAQTQAHASATIAEIGQLVQAASEAPKAAADVVAELRQKLSDSMVRDNAMLEERSRLLETLGTLLDAVNHASTVQRTAVDALVTTSADLLDRVGSSFTDQVDRVSTRFNEDVDRAGTRFTEEVDRVGTGFVEQVDRVGTGFIEQVDRVGTGFIEQVDRVGTTFAEQVDRVGTGFTTHVDRVGTRFNEDVDRAGTRFTEEVDRVGTGFIEQVERLGTGLIEQVDRVGAGFTEQVERVGTSFTEHADLVGITFTDQVDRVGSAFTEHADRVATAFTDQVERVGTTFTGQVERVGTTFTDQVERVGAGFTEQVDRASMAFTEQVDRTGTGFTDEVDKVRTRFTDDVDRAGTHFTDEVAARTEELSGIAAQVTGSAVDVASLGDAFGAAVQVFSQSNEQLVAHLQRIEGALNKSITRSDEQLAYYVAQAREVIDLSMMSQKQIIESLQQLAGQQVSSGTEAA